MNNEEYGIELSLDLNEFQKDINKAIQITKQATDEIKKTTRKVKITQDGEERELIIGDKTKKAVEDLKKGLEEVESVRDRLNSGKIKISTGTSEEYWKELEENAKKITEWQEKQSKTTYTGGDGGFSEIEKATEGLSVNQILQLATEITAETERIKTGVSEDRKSISELAESIRGTNQEAKKMGDSIKQSLNVKVVTVLKSSLSGLKNVFSGITKEAKKFENSIKNNLQKSVLSGTKSLKRFALSLFGIQSGYMAIRKAVNSYMSMDSDLQKSIQQTWAGFGSFLAPILEYVTELFRKFLAYVNAVVTALTGINFVARANAKALDKQAKANANANKKLASFDELQNIKDQNGGGDDGTISLPDVDSEKLNGILNIIDKIKQGLERLFEPIKASWSNYGTPLIESIKSSFFSLVDLGKSVGGSIFDVWTNGTGEEIMNNIFMLWTNVFDIISGIADAINNAWNNAGNGTRIIQGIADIFKYLYEFANEIVETIKNWVVSNEFQEALKYVVEIIADIIEGLSNVAKWIVDIYDKYFKEVMSNILGLIADLIRWFGVLWDAIIKPVANLIGPLLKNNIEAVLQMIGSVINWLVTLIRIDVTRCIAVLQGDIKGFFNSILSLGKQVINGLIGLMNGWINGLNNMLTPVRSIITSISKAFGRNISINQVRVPNIPYLSIGTDLVKEEGMAYLHKGEKVVPANVVKGGYSGSDNSETNALLRQLIEVVDSKEFRTFIGKEEIGKASIDYINQQNRIRGGSVI